MRPRPTVAYSVSEPARAIFDRFERALGSDGAACVGSIGRREITLMLPDGARRVWSPWLQLAVAEDGGATVLTGKMGPHPNLWTAFVFTYAALVALFTAGSVLGLVQLRLGQPAWGLWGTGVATLGLAGSCGLDLLGRRLGRAQMDDLRRFILRVVVDAEELPEPS